MRTRTILTLVTAAAALASAPSALASSRSTQTARDLSVAKAAVTGFHRVSAPTLKRGPLTQSTGCGPVTAVPSGGTVSSESFERVVAESADKRAAVVDELQITTVLAPSVKAAASTYGGLQRADLSCPSQTVATTVGDVPVSAQAQIAVSDAGGIKHAAWGFVETTSYSGTVTVKGSSAPVNGSVQALVYQRGRALSIVVLNRLQLVQSADGKTLVSINHLVSPQTRAELTSAAKLAVARTGAQLP